MPTEKRERQRERRAEKQAAEAAAARRQRMFKLIRNGAIVVAIVILGGLALSTFGGDDTPTTTTQPPSTLDTTNVTTLAAPPANYAEYRTVPAACGAEAPPEAQTLTFGEPEDQGIDPEATVTATLRTSCGDIVLDLDPAAAPETVNSFVFLARAGYFDGTVSHRVVPGFVIQAGDPTATGSGGPGYVIADEFPEDGFNYGRGVVAMANAGAGTTGSQLFLVLADTGLGNTFSVFGTVTEGLDVMDRIASEVPLAALPPNPEPSRPLEAIYINEVVIEIAG